MEQQVLTSRECLRLFIDPFYSNNFMSADMQYNRKCISFILRSVLGGMLSEQAQILACKHLGFLLAGYNNSFGIFGAL